MKAKRCVTAGKGYMITGNSATKAGIHTAKLMADANHQFTGSKTNVKVKWKIAKAAYVLTVKPVEATKTAEAGKKTTIEPFERKVK